MKTLVVLIVLAVALPLALWVAGRLGWLAGTPPADLGVRDGRLKPPSRSPNSVSSQTKLYPDHPRRQTADVEPLRFTSDAATSLARLRAVLPNIEGLRIVQQTADYLRAEARTPGLGFVDDLEFWADPAAGVIHVRSASRLGHRDFGANRARVELIRQRYLAGR